MANQADDLLRMEIPPRYATKEDHAQAYAYLRRRHARGTLPPVEDGSGDPVADYVSILGIKK